MNEYETRQQIALSLDWSNTPPLDVLVKDIRARKAGAEVQARRIAKLEAALKAGKNDEAAKICEELGAAQKEGHKDFKKPDAKKK